MLYVGTHRKVDRGLLGNSQGLFRGVAAGRVSKYCEDSQTSYSSQP